MNARIYKPSRHTMQVGRAKMKNWILDYCPDGSPEHKRHIDPLMSWTSTTQTHTQIRLKFSTQKEAISYAENNGIPYTLIPEQPLNQTIKAYANNFSHDRLT